MKSSGAVVLFICLATVSCFSNGEVYKSSGPSQYSLFAASPKPGSLAVVDIPKGSVRWISTGVMGYATEVETLSGEVYVNVLDPTAADSPSNGLYQLDQSDGLQLSLILKSSGKDGRIYSIASANESLYVLTEDFILLKENGNPDFKQLVKANPHNQARTVLYAAGCLYYVAENHELAQFNLATRKMTYTNPIPNSEQDRLPFAIIGATANELILKKAGGYYALAVGRIEQGDISIIELVQENLTDRIKEVEGKLLMWRVIEYPEVRTKILDINSSKETIIDDIAFYDFCGVPSDIHILQD